MTKDWSLQSSEKMPPEDGRGKERREGRVGYGWTGQRRIGWERAKKGGAG